MKKYVKPELFYEDFELSQHIAACYLTLTNADVTSCQAKVPETGMPIFAVEVVCQVAANKEDYCYVNGTTGFGSTHMS